MCCQVNVTKGTLSQAEIDAYVDHARQKYNREPLSMDIAVDGDEVELSYDFGNVPFQRIRRITGYLVGTLDRFNNAKRAEEHDRVKHGMPARCDNRKGDFFPVRVSEGSRAGFYFFCLRIYNLH